MKRPISLLLLLAVPLRFDALRAEEASGFVSRLSLSPRVGFNISAGFESTATGGSGGVRTTPNGDAYNYDNGYVLTDVSGNAGGQTWYWGYDDSTAQISGNTILLNRTTASGAPTSVSQDADPSPGVELLYQLSLGTHGRLRHGIEAGAAYQYVHASAPGSATATLTATTDAYSFAAGGTPPSATPSSPYQGTSQGPGFLISAAPSSSTTVTTPNVALATQNELRSGLWGFRVGPWVEYDVADRVSLGLSVGVAAGVLNAEVTWQDTAGSTTASGSGTDLGVLMGFYLSSTASWQFAERWRLVGGIEYQNLGTYEHDFDGRTLKLDVGNAIFASVGIGWSF